MKPYAIGIDVGGTKIAAGLVSQNGQILHRFATRAHSQQQPDYVIEAIEHAYHVLLQMGPIEAADIEAICLGFAGTVNGPAGLIFISSNLPAWDHFPLRDVVAKRLGVPVILENDTNLCAVGEHRYGAGRGSKNMCYVTFSTGYGLGIIINNQLYVGHTGTAGEIGHVSFDRNGPLCTCGKNGCIMAYASGIGLSRMAYEKIEAGAETVLRQLAPDDGQRFSGELIAQAANQGDEVAREILQLAGYYGGVALAMIIEILNPELMVLGGGLSHIGPLLLDPLVAAMKAHTQPELWNSARLVPWTLGDDIGILGAAAHVFT